MSDSKATAEMIARFMDAIDTAKRRDAVGDLSMIAYGVVTELAKTQARLSECVEALEECKTMIDDECIEDSLSTIERAKSAIAKARKLGEVTA